MAGAIRISTLVRSGIPVLRNAVFANMDPGSSAG
jgi:hypothetical protein